MEELDSPGDFANYYLRTCGLLFFNAFNDAFLRGIGGFSELFTRVYGKRRHFEANAIGTLGFEKAGICKHETSENNVDEKDCIQELHAILWNNPVE